MSETLRRVKRAVVARQLYRVGSANAIRKQLKCSRFTVERALRLVQAEGNVPAKFRRCFPAAVKWRPGFVLTDRGDMVRVIATTAAAV